MKNVKAIRQVLHWEDGHREELRITRVGGDLTPMDCVGTTRMRDAILQGKDTGRVKLQYAMFEVEG